MKNIKPKVSIVMSVFNADKYVHKAIESILNQTLKDFEFIIVNDASKDKTIAILKSYAKKDKRIKLINNAHNLKIAHSLNIGIAAAKADLIARMDADDVSHHPERLETQYLFLKRHPKTAIVGANISIVNKEGKEIWKREYRTKSKELKKTMFLYSPFAHPTVMFRKKVFKEFGGYDPDLVPCEDIDLWFKIGTKYDFGNIPRTLLRYYMSENSVSHHDLRNTELLGFKIKLNAIRKLGYRPTLYDITYNLLQFLSMWVVLTKIRIKLYNLLRSRGII